MENEKIIEAVKKAIDDKTKNFKKIMGPNTKKLINTTNAREFKQALQKKNWLGTNPVHAAAIVVKGAVVVPEDTQSIKKYINTLAEATEYNDIETIIDSFCDNKSKNALKKVITKYTKKDKQTFFKKINSIASGVPVGLLNNSSGSEEINSTYTTHFTPILANITHVCDEAIEKYEELNRDELSGLIDDLISNLKRFAGIDNSNNSDDGDQKKVTAFESRFKKFLKCIETGRNREYQVEDHLYIMQNISTEKLRNDTILDIAKKVQETLSVLIDREISLNEQTQNSESTSDAQTQTHQSNGESEIANQPSYRSSTLDAQSEELEKRRQQQEEAIKTWTDNNPQTSITSPVLPQATTNENNALTKFKSVTDTLSKYSKKEKLSEYSTEEKWSDEQKAEFIKDLKALKNDAPLTSYYLLTYLEQEGNTLTDDERSALLETPHGDDNYDYEDDHENAKKELMDQMTEKDAVKILGDFEEIIEENYKKIKKINKRTTMHQQSELDASVPPIQIVSHQ